MKPVRLEGKVKKYSGNGRKLGYPTANISADNNLANGVYFGYATLGKYKNNPAMIFIGTPTTIGDTEHRIEAHLFDIKDDDYYGETITIQINYFHRENQTFDTIQDLENAMRSDEAAARKRFSRRFE